MAPNESDLDKVPKSSKITIVSIFREMKEHMNILLDDPGRTQAAVLMASIEMTKED